MDIGMIIKRSAGNQSIEYFTGDDWTSSKNNAMLYVSEAVFTDAVAHVGFVHIRLLDGTEISVSRGQIFFPTHRSLQ